MTAFFQHMKIPDRMRSCALWVYIAVSSMHKTWDSAALRHFLTKPRIVAALAYLPVLLVLAISLYFEVPYFKDSNETFLSFNQGWSLVFGHPWTVSFLTNCRTFEHNDMIYAHNPNSPRYLHAILLLLGMRDIVIHVVLISCASFLLTAFFVTQLFDRRMALTIMAFTVLDWVGFQYFTNTYRTWSFPLFWGCLWAMRRRWTAFVAFFILFQFEYGFAAFVSITALAFHPRWRERFWAIGGAFLSVAVFGVQVISYMGMDKLIKEMASTVEYRVLSGVFSWPGFYSQLVLVLVAGALIFVRKTGTGRLFASMIAGGLVAFLAMRGYVLDAFIAHGLPFLTFFVVVAFSLWAARLRWLAPLLAFPLLFNSVANLKAFPPVPRGYIEATRAAPGPVTSPGPLFGIAFAIRPENANPVYELCLDRPWLFVSCGAPYSIKPLSANATAN